MFKSKSSDVCFVAAYGLVRSSQRKAIHNSFISSHFKYCLLVRFFKGKASIAKMQRIQERALRFVLKDSISDYETLLSKGELDSLIISYIKNHGGWNIQDFKRYGPGIFMAFIFKIHYTTIQSNHLSEQLLSEQNLLLTLGPIYGTCYRIILNNLCLCIILSHWYAHGRVLLVGALSVRRLSDFGTVFLNLYIMGYDFFDLLVYIWITLLSFVALISIHVYFVLLTLSFLSLFAKWFVRLLNFTGHSCRFKVLYCMRDL